MEETIEIYNHYPKFENYNPMHYNNDKNKISDIENEFLNGNFNPVLLHVR